MKNNKNTINLNESLCSSEEQESQENFDLDNDELNLVDVFKKTLAKRNKKNKNSLLLRNKRKHPDNNNIIIYDSSSKKIINSFCPSYEELDEFLENCKVEEINISEIEDELKDEEDVFNVKQFMMENKIMKSYLSLEDLENKEEEEIEEKNKIIYPLIIPTITPQAEEKTENSSMKNIKKILNSDNLDSYQKVWLNNYLKNISDMPLSSVIKKRKKLEIIFDLDNTMIFSFVNSHNKEEIKEFIENNPEKCMYFLSFKHQKKNIYSSFIIRQGIEEFINYAKKFCVFHIRTLSIKPYARKIISILEKELHIKFDRNIMRDGRKKILKLCKSIEEFDCNYINNNNTVIFDDNVLVWEDDSINVIPSKKYFDKEVGIDSIKGNSTIDNNITCLLNSHGKFYYHFFQNDENRRNQNLTKLRKCPFYHFKQIDNQFFFDVYNGEYFESKKKQFVYMKNIIKIIYYMLYNDNIPVYESIKLIRLNALYGKYFYLKYVENVKKDDLIKIIQICGGEIIEPDDSIEFKMKKIYLVCSYGIYEKERNSIRYEVKNNPNYILVNEKFVLDSYYFMSDLGNENLDDDYDPERFYKIGKIIFK